MAITMASSDGSLKLEDILVTKNPGVHLLKVLDENAGERPSMEDFSKQMDKVAEEREKASKERDKASEALERLRRSLDAFKVAKPFKEMTTKEKCVWLLNRFGVRHTIVKVTKRLATSPVYKALLQEQAAKRAAAAKKRG